MKIVKGLATFSFLVILFGSCFDPPEFPNTPEIDFEKIEFVDGEIDSLILYINFKDGNGDLGLDADNTDFISDPYHSTYFFQENNGKLDSITTRAVKPGATEQYDILNISDPSKGKLVFPRTRKKPGYGFLPTYSCANYERTVSRKILIEEADLAVLDASVKIVDTINSGQSNRYFQIQDTLYYKPNPNHYNIEIDFFVQEGSGFVEFDWRKEYCQTFDGRFPVLSQTATALDGTLKYSMNSLGFLNIFSIKRMKLRIQIKDQALQRSNIIETDEFDLTQIKRRG